MLRESHPKSKEYSSAIIANPPHPFCLLSMWLQPLLWSAPGRIDDCHSGCKWALMEIKPPNDPSCHNCNEKAESCFDLACGCCCCCSTSPGDGPSLRMDFCTSPLLTQNSPCVAHPALPLAFGSVSLFVIKWKYQAQMFRWHWAAEGQ